MARTPVKENSHLSDIRSSSDGLSTKILQISGRECLIHGQPGDPFFDALTPACFESIAAGSYGGFDSFCSRYLRPDYWMIDVGANIGITSLIAAAYLPEGKVVAVEASPRNCIALEANFRRNGLETAEVVPFAVGSAPGELEFNEAGAHGHVLTPSVALGRVGITVPVKTIDQIVADLELPKVDFIKLDIEGFERDAIIGAEETIMRWDPLFYIEFNSWCQIALHNESPLRFYDFLSERFQYVYKIRENHMIPLEKGQGLHFLHENIVHHGCVEDVVASTSADRLIEAPNYLEKVIGNLRRERDRMRQERDSLLVQESLHAELQAGYGKLQAEYEQLQAEYGKLRTERDRVASKLQRIKHSVFWRLGGPFRKMRKKFS